MQQVNGAPRHIAIIMDGNRRWAKAQGLPVIAGHKKVADEILEPLVEAAAKRGIKFLTLWAFSTENWQRPKVEVAAIMQIMRSNLPVFGEKMHKKGIRIRAIGDLTRFDQDIQDEVERLVKLTADNTRITVVFALNYGGRDELLRAVNNLQIYKSTNLQINNSNEKMRQTTEEEFENYLDTRGIPDPEMIVRTAGEQRMSGFLPWQSVYSEYYFPSWPMPEFTTDKLDEVIAEYEKRKRRFGR